MTDNDKDTIAKLTADNAALRAELRRVPDCWDENAALRQALDDEKAMHEATKLWLAQQPNEAKAAGWVSPEEHARVVTAAEEKIDAILRAALASPTPAQGDEVKK